MKQPAQNPTNRQTRSPARIYMLSRIVRQASPIRVGAVLLLVAVLLLGGLPATGTLAAPPSDQPDQTDQIDQTDQTQPEPSQTSEDNPFAPATSRIEVEVSLGSVQQVGVELTNTGSISAIPTFYEAYGPPAPGVSLQAVLPESLRSVGLPRQTERVDPEIRRQLAAAPDETTEFLVFLADQADLSAAYAIDDWAARGWFVYHALHEVASRSQQDLRTWLEAEHIPHQPLWIANAMIVQGRAAEVEALAARSDVALLRANYQLSLALPDDATLPPRLLYPDRLRPLAQTGDVQWHVRQVQADRVWADFGVSGQGIVVANIDSGVLYEHVALRQNYRGYRADSNPVADYNWFDPGNSFEQPGDEIGHGTHVMGLMAARADLDGLPVVGIAPGATWIAARGCSGFSCLETDLLQAAQWVLAPTDSNGENPRPDLRPHIVNGSFAGQSGDPYYQEYTNAWRAAGMFPVFAAGNVNTLRCSSSGSPGDYANVVGVGATNRNDLIGSFSGMGPTVDGRIKPDLVAPGADILSTYATGPEQFTTLKGTSMASPVVAGSVALLWAANPTLIGDYAATYRLLIDTALPITDETFNAPRFAQCPAESVPNNVYGHGRLNAYAAVAEARVDVPWLELPTAPLLAANETRSISLTLDMRQIAAPGVYQARLLVGTGNLSQSLAPVDLVVTVPETPAQALVQGTVQEAETNTPLSGRVLLESGLSVPIESSGHFSLTLPVRTEPYSLTTHVYQYINQTRSVQVDSAEPRDVQFHLVADQPRVAVTPAAAAATMAYQAQSLLSVLVTNVGTRPLTYSVEVPPEQFGVWRSDNDKTVLYDWVELPDDAAVLNLADDAFSAPVDIGFAFSIGGTVYEQVSIGSNGVLVFAPEQEPGYFTPSCTTLPETEGPAIAPLRLDLDPSMQMQGITPTIRAATTEAGFVVSYEHVPRYGSAPDENDTFTFQIILKPAGAFAIQYKDLSDLDAFTSVGVQTSGTAYQGIGCGERLPIAEELRLELYPQIDSQLWLSVNSPSQGTLMPAGQAIINMQLQGVPAINSRQVSRGSLLFSTNDPQQPQVRVPVELTTQPAPYRLFTPLVLKNL